LTGAQLALLPFLALVLPVVAALAWWLKRRYTAAVVRFQTAGRSSDTARDGDTIADAFVDASAPHPPAPPLEITVRAAEESSSVDAGDRLADAVHLRRRVLLVHAVSELVYWGTVTIALVVVFAGRDALTVLRMLAPSLLPFVLIPIAVAWIVQAGMPRTLMTVASAAVVICAFGLLRADAEGWQSSIGFTLGYASIALMLSAFLRPTIRGAGIPLIASAIAGWAALVVLFAAALAFDADDGSSTSLTELAAGIIELLLICGVSAWCGWRTLRALSVRYAAKRFSDVQLALGTFWLLLTVFVMGSLVRNPELFLFKPVRPEWIALGIVSLWVVWRPLQAAALRVAVRDAAPSIGPLLLLRVFKPSGRSQAFTDRFFAYWRFAAPVWMIGGPDLAAAYLEPNEFFSFVTRRLREQFVADPDAAAGQVETLDRRRDPDGRFRVTELYCTADTWRPAVLEMMARAGVILLDLREFSEKRLGTRYELTEVLRRAPLGKVLLLVDASDDGTKLRAEIQSAWRDVGCSRVDIGELEHLSVLQFRKGSRAEMYGLFRAAFRAAYRERGGTPATLTLRA
jgi:hypothetical protein